MTRLGFLFAIAILLPAALIGAGALWGGGWALAALLVMTLVASAADHLLPEADAQGEAANGTALMVVLALVHLALLAAVVWALAGAGHDRGAKLALFFAAGLYFGQISNANAHELIHRPQRALHLLGMWVYISLLYGQHTSAHRHVHHRYVGTARDPNTARAGEGFYRYLPRAWWGEFVAGFAAERARRPAWRNPYWLYLGGGAAFAALALGLAGGAGLAAYLGLAFYAQMQLLLSDYVQHYGLRRAIGADGRPEPVSARHSWNSPHLVSGLMLLHASRHSDHHTSPARAYPALRLDDQMPMLPYPLPLMASIALIPPLWRRLMDRRAARWRNPLA